MSEYEEKDLSFAKIIWFQLHYRYKELEKENSPYLSPEISAWRPTPKYGRLKIIRNALNLSLETVADRAGFSRGAFANFEKTEAAGNITLNSLRKCAEAMDCELVVAIRPKNKVGFSEVVWNVLCKEALRLAKKRSKGPVHLKSHRLASVAAELMANSKFRKLQGWSLRK